MELLILSAVALNVVLTLAGSGRITLPWPRLRKERTRLTPAAEQQFTVTICTAQGARARDYFLGLELEPEDTCIFAERGVVRDQRMTT